MFIIDKYVPKNMNESKIHQDILNMLKTISTDESIPNINFYGPEGSGKKTIIKLLLEMIFDKDVNNVDDCIYNVSGSGNKITEVLIKQSNYHIVIEPNNNNFDKYLIQDVVKEYAKKIPLNVFKTKKIFKIVLINCVDHLSYYAQTSLRRTMEKYSSTCRFIMWCRSLSKVIEPLKSRCLNIRVPSPNDNTLVKLLINICGNENIKNMSIQQYSNILINSNGNIKLALWNLDLISHNIYSNDTYVYKIKEIADLISSCDLSVIDSVRTSLYYIIITNISCGEIFKQLMLAFCEIKTINNTIKFKIIEGAAKYEHNLARARRDIVHLFSFLTFVMQIIYEDSINKTNNNLFRIL